MIKRKTLADIPSRRKIGFLSGLITKISFMKSSGSKIVSLMLKIFLEQFSLDQTLSAKYIYLGYISVQINFYSSQKLY
jgi:hypothetical protein